MFNVVISRTGFVFLQVPASCKCRRRPYLMLDHRLAPNKSDSVPGIQVGGTTRDVDDCHKKLAPYVRRGRTPCHTHTYRSLRQSCCKSSATRHHTKDLPRLVATDRNIPRSFLTVIRENMCSIRTCVRRCSLGSFTEPAREVKVSLGCCASPPCPSRLFTCHMQLVRTSASRTQAPGVLTRTAGSARWPSHVCGRSRPNMEEGATPVYRSSCPAFRGDTTFSVVLSQAGIYPFWGAGSREAKAKLRLEETRSRRRRGSLDWENASTRDKTSVLE